MCDWCLKLRNEYTTLEEIGLHENLTFEKIIAMVVATIVIAQKNIN